MQRVLPVGVVVMALAGIFLSAWGIIKITRPYDMPLDDGLERSTLFVDRTADAVAPDREHRSEPMNSDPDRVAMLSNNHSFNDHSVDGYNDCDSWRNVIHDGWSASYGVEFSIAGDDDAARLIQNTRDFWVREGRDVQTQLTGDQLTRLWFKTDYATFQFNVDTGRATATVRAVTYCLSP